MQIIESELQIIPLTVLEADQESEGAVGKITGLPAGVVPLAELVNPTDLVHETAEVVQK